MKLTTIGLTLFASAAVTLAGGAPLRTLDMVHHNPGEKPTQSKFLEPAYLAAMGSGAKVVNDFQAPQCACTFDELDPTIFPADSDSRKWVEDFTESCERRAKACHAAGIKCYYFMDIIVLPRELIRKYRSEICDANGKVSFDREKTWEIHRLMLREMLRRIPSVDGFVIRTGEMYSHNVPYHGGNTPVNYRKDPEGFVKTHARLLQLLREEVCVKANREVIYRTWDFMCFHTRPDIYHAITDQIEPHPKLVMSIKHTCGDYLRYTTFNPTLGIGKHRQLVEFQCQREYEGKGAYPNYVVKGAVEGFEENRGVPGRQGLRDLLATPQFAGVWTWSRGGGWEGPYLRNEFWCELNAYVMTAWANDPAAGEEAAFEKFMEAKKIEPASRAAFRKLALLSADAVVRGLGNLPPESVKACWTRDHFIGDYDWLKTDYARLVSNRLVQVALANKRESVRLWEEIVRLAATVRMADKADEHYLRTSAQYGLRLYRIYEAGWTVTLLGYEGDQTGKYDRKAIAEGIRRYDEAWRDYRQLPVEASDCATLFDGWFAAYNISQDHNSIDPVPGMNAAVDRYRNLSERPAPRPALLQRINAGIELIGIVHWGVNTYTDRGWGLGDEDPAILNPSGFDAEQIVRTAKAGGLQGLVIVAKHHDGMCLWPTKTTPHNITKTPFRQGKGDYVREMSEACRKYGLKFGVYCSPWDRNNADYATDKYVETFHAQIKELLDGRYGDIFEMWFDNANGGDGYYGGARETRKIPSGYYRFDEVFRFVRQLQPSVCIFNEDDGADFRWPGNERGILSNDCRATSAHFDIAKYGDYMKWAGRGVVDGVCFHPPEADFPLRDEWFYHESEKGTTKSAAFLMQRYLGTVGNGGTMNIGLAPDKVGVMCEDDVAALRGFGELQRRFFANPVQKGLCNVVVMREEVSRGERVDGWKLVAAGKTVASGQSIGIKRIRILSQPVEVKSLKLEAVGDDVRMLPMAFYRVDEALLREIASAGTKAGETETAKRMNAAREQVARPTVTLLPAPRELTLTGGWVKNPAVEVTRDSSLREEGYRLEITPSGVLIAAADDAGAFYARQTLAQLAEPQGVPCCKVKDWPEFPYRGLMIDDGRHFFGKAHVLKTLEWMAKYKFNKFHWHLCEDQGWRIQIDKYPNLTTYGATRARSPLPGRYTKAYDNQQYGPFFYTKADIREVVAKAKELHIEVIPDLEMPGHARSVIAAYPELGCPNSPLDERTAWTDWGICDDVFCLGNEQVYTFWCNVIDEVCEMFPSSKINMCGDECTTRNWSKCPKCQAKAKELGLKSIGHLQGWMTQRITAYIRYKGRYYMGYSDGMGHGAVLKPEDVVAIAGSQMGGAEAAASGYKVVMAPVEYCYWDFNQGLAGDPYIYGTWWSGSIPLAQVFSFCPRLGLSGRSGRNVIGGLAFNWSEYTSTPQELEWKMWPRAIALSQALWNPQGGYDFAEKFLPALPTHLERLRAAGVNCAPWSAESRRATTGGLSDENQVMDVED